MEFRLSQMGSADLVGYPVVFSLVSEYTARVDTVSINKLGLEYIGFSTCEEPSW